MIRAGGDRRETTAFQTIGAAAPSHLDALNPF